MPKRRIVFVIVASLICLIALFVVGVWLFVKPEAFRQQIEAAGSRAMGMQVTVGGRIAIGLSPRPHLELEDVGISKNGGKVISAKQAALEIQLIPLLHGELSVDRVALQDVGMFAQRDRDGRFNFQNSGPSGGETAGFELATLSLDNASLHFEAQEPWEAFQASDCKLDLRDLRASNPQHADFMRHLSVSGHILCGQVTSDEISASDLKASVAANDGTFEFDPITLRTLDASGAGRIVVDFSAVPARWNVQFSLPQFPIESFFQRLPSQRQIATAPWISPRR